MRTRSLGQSDTPFSPFFPEVSLKMDVGLHGLGSTKVHCHERALYFKTFLFFLLYNEFLDAFVELVPAMLPR